MNRNGWVRGTIVLGSFTRARMTELAMFPRLDCAKCESSCISSGNSRLRAAFCLPSQSVYFILRIARLLRVAALSGPPPTAPFTPKSGNISLRRVGF